MKTTTMIIAALAMTTSAAFAQDAAAPATEAAPAAQTTTDAATTQAPAAPTARTVGEFGAWTVSCIDEPAESASCVVLQNIGLGEEGQENAQSLGIFFEKANKSAPLVLAVGAPLGIAIEPGVSLLMNGTDLSRVWYAPFDTCMPQMCIARSTVNETVLLQAETPALAFSLSDYRLIGVPFQTEGLEEALAALNAELPDAPAAEEAPAAAPAPETAPAE